MHRVDGDSALLGFIVLLGALPLGADLTTARAVGGLSTLGLIAASAALYGLWGRLTLLLGARSIRRRLLARGQQVP